MFDACGSLAVSGFGWQWDDEAAAPMPEGSGTNVCSIHRPANYGSGDLRPAPAPAGPYATTLSAFDFTNPDGEWSMFVNHDADGSTGFFTNRFQLQITTDSTAPPVTSVSPANNASGVGLAAKVGATFSEAMRASSINTNTLKFFKAGTTTPIPATVTYGATTKREILDPNANLRLRTRCKAMVTTGVKDRAGNRLDQDPTHLGNQPKA